MKQISLIALAVALLPGMAMAATSTGTGDAHAKVVEAVAVTQDSGEELNFGTMIAPETAQTVTVDSSGSRTASDSSILVTDSSNAPRAGGFTITGPTGQSITVTLPNNAQISNGTQTMTISSFTGTNTGSQTIPAGGLSLDVGGTLAVGADQAQGTYNGTYTITVTY